MKPADLALWAGQILASAIMAFAGAAKLVGTEGSKFIFMALEMEPLGRYLIGTIEVLAAVLLLTRGFSALGALLAVGTMAGAAIAHSTHLGVNVQSDGGMHIMMLMLVLIGATPTLIVRRKTLPLIGPTL